MLINFINIIFTNIFQIGDSEVIAYVSALGRATDTYLGNKISKPRELDRGSGFVQKSNCQKV